MLLQKYHELLLISFLLLGSITAFDVYNNVVPSLETSVQGVQIETSQVQDSIPSVTPTSTPTPTNNAQLTNATPTTQPKQVGGWYWQPELGRAQQWMGIDTQGNDIWKDLVVAQVLGSSTSGGDSQAQTQPATSTSVSSSTSSSTNTQQSTPTPTSTPTMSTLGTTESKGMTQTQSGGGVQVSSQVQQ